MAALLSVTDCNNLITATLARPHASKTVVAEGIADIQSVIVRLQSTGQSTNQTDLKAIYDKILDYYQQAA